MRARFRSWWQKIKQHPVASIAIIIAGIVMVALIYAEIRFYGTGFDGYTQVTTANTISGPSTGTVVRTEVYQPGKALWDWLQLLIIPAVLTFGVWWLTRLQQKRDQRLADQRAQIEHEAAEKRDQTERDSALDNQREAALQSYLDSMSALLLDNKMISGTPHLYKVPSIARVRTLTLLPRLDGRRIASVLQFLYESGLIEKGKRIVDLSGADLNGADLLGAQLSGADLSGASLCEANLFLANLSEANLSSTVLTAANLFQANLSGANLEKAFLDGGADLRFATLNGTNLQEAKLKGTNLQGTDAASNQLDEAIFYESVTMPDGTKHD